MIRRAPWLDAASWRLRALAAGLDAVLVLAAGTVLVSIAGAATVLAADPTASPAGGDVRTTPAAPGLVGDPLLALAGVAVIGLLAVALTLLGARLTRPR